MEYYRDSHAIHLAYLVVVISVILNILIAPGSCTEDSTTSGSGGGSTHQNVNHVIDYFHTLKRSQDETFRKIDWLIKTIEERDHEDYKFRLKFSRKVHTLENKVAYLEQTFSQKVEEVVQKKVDEISERLRYQYENISGGPPTPSNSHGSIIPSDTQVQNHPPFIVNQNRYQSPQYHHQARYPNNWGFYEHPITQKRVINSNFGFEPPTRDFALMSLVASAPNVASSVSPSSRTSDVKGSLISTRSDSEATRERNDHPATSKFVEEAQKRFESYDVTLQALRENVTNVEKAIASISKTVQYQYQNKDNDNNEVYKILVENSKEANNLNQKYQELAQRIEHFSVETEKSARIREHAVNESLKEMSSEIKKQISSVKTYTKRQLQNFTATTSGSSQTPDKLRCAQTLLDEILAQLSKPQSQQNPFNQTDLIADQAARDDARGSRMINYRTHTTDYLSMELQLQRNEIMDLKSDMGKLNNSQILLRRTVDEETLKRTVRPRDCSEIRLLRNVSSGIYSIFPKLNDISEDVVCDMETDGGGWTVILRRGEQYSGEETRESFSRNWEDYEQGFGSLNADFWLGLSNIAALSQLGIQQLRIELTNWSGETRFATYRYFKIANDTENYKINVSTYSGTAGDSLTRHNGMPFSTPDKDHDIDPRRHCAKTYSSGWWYYACFESNLTGRYHDEKESNATNIYGRGIIWQHWMGSYNSLKRVQMKIRNTFIGDNQYANKVFLSR